MSDVRYLPVKRWTGRSWFSAGLVDVSIYPELVPFCLPRAERVPGVGLGCPAPAGQGHEVVERSPSSKHFYLKSEKGFA